MKFKSKPGPFSDALQKHGITTSMALATASGIGRAAALKAMSGEVITPGPAFKIADALAVPVSEIFQDGNHE